MGEAREFIFSLMVISVSCAAVNMLTPDNSGVSRYVCFLVSLIVTAVLLSPLQSALAVLPELASKEINIDMSTQEVDIMTYADSVINETCKNIESELILQIENRFGIRPVVVTVVCDSEDVERVIISKVTVVYDSNNTLLFSDTKKYIEEIMECECEVKPTEVD